MRRMGETRSTTSRTINRSKLCAWLCAVPLVAPTFALAGDFCPCSGDLNIDGVVNGADLGILLAAWGPCPGCPADISGTGTVDGADLGILLSMWGPCSAGVPNDTCASAIHVVSFTGSANPFCTIGATTDGPVLTGCGGAAPDQIQSDVWFRVTLPIDGTYQIGACGDFPVRVAVYSALPGAGCPCSGGTGFGTLVGCAGTAVYPTCLQGAVVLVPALAGDCIMVRIGSTTGEQGTGGLDINVFVPPCELESTTVVAASALESDSELGLSVDIDGERAVASAVFDDLPPIATNAGSVRVYNWSGQTWTAQQTLVSPSPFTLERFGLHTAVSGDWIIVGAGAKDAACEASPFCDTGAAHIYHFEGGSWVHDQKLLPSGGSSEDHFGYRVDIDGARAIVGASDDDNANGDRAGAAFVFEYVPLLGGFWAQTSKLLAPDGANFDEFGSAVAVSGEWAIVSADHADGPNGPNSGRAYMYRDDPGGWVHVATLAPSSLAASAGFGSSLAIDGDLAVVGAPANASAPGAAYVYENLPGPGWTLIATLTSHDGANGDRFGSSVSVKGNQIMIGATGDDNNRGAAYVYWRVAGGVIERAKLTAANGVAGDSFGVVAIDDGHGLVGAYLRDIGIIPDVGSVYLFNGLGDCTGNVVVDGCDIASGLPDSDGDGVPDVCEP